MKKIFNFKSFTPDNASGMDRKRTGNGSALPRYLFTLLFALFLCAGQIWGNETFTAGTDKSDDTSIEKGCVTISFTDGTFSRDDNYRCYANKSMTIESVHSITKIEITCTGSGTSSNGPGKFSLKSGVSGSYSYSGKVGTWSYASGATSITLNASAQVRMTEIVVTYAVTAPTSVTKGTITTSSAGLTITDSKNTGSYEIYYSTNSGAPNANTTATTTVTTKTPTLTSLSDGTTYYVWVRSKCSDDSKSSWTALTGGSFSTPSAGPACTDPDGPGKGSFF